MVKISCQTLVAKKSPRKIFVKVFYFTGTGILFAPGDFLCAHKNMFITCTTRSELLLFMISQVSYSNTHMK